MFVVHSTYVRTYTVRTHRFLTLWAERGVITNDGIGSSPPTVKKVCAVDNVVSVARLT